MSRQVSDTKLPKQTRVSTVKLDMSDKMLRMIDDILGHNMERKPFETMVFQGKSWNPLDSKCYSTEEEAREGHAAMVAKWQAKLTGGAN